ncbi:AsmA-like C-terminal region-containing protein [Amylibacter sp.]|nr:AsmA-like C-terminal region-containing protein [Amylibacter sp.]
MVDIDQKNQKKSTFTFQLITKFFRWFIYSIILVIFVIPTLFLSYIFLDEDASFIEVPILKGFVERNLEQQFVKFEISLGKGGISKGDKLFSPKFVFLDVQVDDKNSVSSYKFPHVSVNLDFLYGSKKGNLSIDNAQLFIRRDMSGKFNIASTKNNVADNNEFFKQIDISTNSFLNLPILGSIDKISANNIIINYQDDKSKNSYLFENGTLNIFKDMRDLSLSSSFVLIDDKKNKSVFKISGNHIIDNDVFNTSLKIENADPITLADQIPALDWLRNIETNVNASIITSFDLNAKILDMDGMIELGPGQLRATPRYSSSKFTYAKSYFKYDLTSDIIDFSSFEFKSKQISAIGSAKNILIRDQYFNIIGSNTDLNIKDMKINRPDIFENEIIFLNSGAAKINTNFEPFLLNIISSNIKIDEANLHIVGNLTAKENFWDSNFNIKIDKINQNNIKNLWPINYKIKARKWVIDNFNKATFSDIKGNILRSNGKNELDFRFNFDDANINVIKSVVPLINISGDGSLSTNQITFNLNNGIFETSPGLFTDISGSIFHIADTKVVPSIGQLKLYSNGNLKSFFELLDSEKFKYLKKAGFKTDVVQGQVEMEGWMEWPLVKGVTQNQVEFEAEGVLSDIKSKNVIKNRIVEAKNLSLKVSDKKLSIFGKSKVDDLPVSFSWNQNLKNNTERVSTLNAKFNIDQNSFDIFNIKLPQNMFLGSAAADLKIDLNPKNPNKFVINSKLKGAELNVNSLGWSNKNIKDGSLIVRGALSTPVDVDEIKILVDDLSASGKINFENDGRFKSAVFPIIKVADWFSTSLTLSKSEDAHVMELQGGNVDFRQLVFGKNDNTEVGILKVALDSLRISDGIEFTNFISEIDYSKKDLGSFRAQINGGAEIYGNLSKGEFGTIISLNGDDAGHVLRSAGILKNIRGGKINLVLTPNKKDGYYTGRFITNKFRMMHSSPLALLLDSLSLVGLVDKLENEGIQFDQAKGWLNITPDGIQLRDVSLVGISMGMSITGWYDKQKKSINFDGVVTPVYAINGVFERLAGKLFGEQKGEGLFSFVYTMKGPTSSPKVEVKPLSILTPGGFRKIFRADIPAPSK